MTTKRDSFLFTHEDGRIVELMEYRRKPDMSFISANRIRTDRRPRVKHRKRIRPLLLKRDGNNCHYCNEVMDEQESGKQPGSKTMTIEHIVPHSKGGPNVLDNLVLACHDCNSARADEPDKCSCGFCQSAILKYRR